MVRSGATHFRTGALQHIATETRPAILACNIKRLPSPASSRPQSDNGGKTAKRKFFAHSHCTRSAIAWTACLAWNETPWSITLTSGRAGTLTAFISSFSSPQGLFLAKLSAASLLASSPSCCSAGSAKSNSCVASPSER